MGSIPMPEPKPPGYTWLHGDDLIRSIRAPLPKAAGLVDLSRVTSFLNDHHERPELPPNSSFVIRKTRHSPKTLL